MDSALNFGKVRRAVAANRTNGEACMRLTPPSFPIFLISAILVALVIAAKYFGVAVPVVSPIVKKSMFEVLLVAYGLLFLDVVFRRL